jgi:hypothetical protein
VLISRKTTPGAARAAYDERGRAVERDSGGSADSDRDREAVPQPPVVVDVVEA